MRVVAGKLGGRHFEAPHGHRTHPMSEKARGALFNALGDISGLSFLDAFSGTGALAFEAVSRGAQFVQAVEIDPQAYKTIRSNCASLGLSESVRIIRKDVKSWSRQFRDVHFDVVLCDPPYDDVRYTLLIQLASQAKLGGLVVYSLPPDHTFSLPTEQFKVISKKTYGDALLVFYRRIS